jgi:hypothetical protein
MGTAEQDKVYVVQTTTKVIQRCLLMTTDPGDLVLDPTCGSGTTAYVAEQWGRRWITMDTSRVALALVGCCRFRGHLVKVEHGTGGVGWQREGSSAASSRLRR